MNKQLFVVIGVILFVVIAVILVSMCTFHSMSGQQGRDVDDSKVSLLTEAEARIIAEQFCVKGGEVLLSGIYNEITKTWWFDANLNSAQKGCNPACVVSEALKTAEINWRCTGMLPPSNGTMTDACGVANCHGLELECGKPVEMCTEVYQLGDKCRKFAKCGMVSGKCQQIENREFSSCASCVQACEKDFMGNSDKIFDCEGKCGE